MIYWILINDKYKFFIADGDKTGTVIFDSIIFDFNIFQRQILDFKYKGVLPDKQLMDILIKYDMFETDDNYFVTGKNFYFFEKVIKDMGIW